MMIQYKRITLCLVILLAVMGSMMFFSAQKGEAQQSIRFAVTDLEGLEQLQREFGAFQELLSQKSGMLVEFFPVPNRTAAVEAVKSKKIDLVLTGPAEYVVFRKLTKAVPVVAFSRPDYFSDIIVLAESGIQNIQDLKGKKVAFGGVGSTSKHLAPMQIIADHELDPRKDITAVHTSVELGWQGLKRGDVAAFCTTDDKFLAARKKETELPPGAFRVIARGADLPNDILLAGSHVSEEMIEKFRTVFIENKQALAAAIVAEGEETQKYQGMTFLAGVKDSDYDYVRKMYATIGYPQFSEFIEE